MINLEILSVILLQIILIVLFIVVFLTLNRKNDDNSAMLQDILIDPNNMKELGNSIGQGFYHSLTKATAQYRGQHNKNVKQLRSMIFDNLIPQQFLQMLPEPAQAFISNKPEMIPELLKIVSTIQKDGFGKGLQDILQLINLEGLSPSEIINSRLQQVQQQKSETLNTQQQT